jgi:thioredoxin-related protein
MVGVGVIVQRFWTADQAMKQESARYALFQKSNKPRVLEFYSDSPDSQEYRKILIKTATKYADRLELAEISVANADLKKVKEMYAVTSTPHTVFLDPFGRRIIDVKGKLTAEKLEGYLAPLSIGGELPMN